MIDKALALAEPIPSQPQIAAPPLDFRAIYEAHFAYVWHSLRRLGVQERDREDLAHDVFVVFYRGLDSYDRSRPLRPWLFGISFRVASDHRRRAFVQREVMTDRYEATDQAPRADEQLAAAQERELVMAALSNMELERRAVFVMHEIDGYSMPEIAEVLTAPLNTLYSRLRLARVEFTESVRRLRDKRKK